MSTAHKITVFGRASSSNVQAVMWGAAELGLDIDRVDIGHIHGGNNTPEYLVMNPHGLVPTLKDGDLTVFESAAILRYLASTYGDGGDFWPTDLSDRARIDQWAEWAKTSFAPAFTAPIFWLRVRTSVDDCNEDQLLANISAFEGKLDALERQLTGQDYVCGNALTLADVMVGHVLYRWFDIDIVRRSRPVVEAYYHRLSKRPAYQQHVCINYDILRDPNA
jgi:glutathione S-transferase